MHLIPVVWLLYLAALWYKKSTSLPKLIKSCLVKFFDKNYVLHDRQYGFRNNHSVTHPLLDVITHSFDAIQNKENTVLLLMDLRKAFDTVSHSFLLQKLYHYGIRGPAYALLKAICLLAISL